METDWNTTPRSPFLKFGLICDLQLPEFTSTVATVSRPACLTNFTKILVFISKKGLRGALDILLFFIFCPVSRVYLAKFFFVDVKCLLISHSLRLRS